MKESIARENLTTWLFLMLSLLAITVPGSHAQTIPAEEQPLPALRILDGEVATLKRNALEIKGELILFEQEAFARSGEMGPLVASREVEENEDIFQTLSYAQLAIALNQPSNDGKKPTHPSLASLYVSYGLLSEAVEALRHAEDDILPERERDTLWLQIANAYLREGLYDETLSSLAQLSKKPSRDFQRQRLSLRGAVHLARHEYSKASEVFKDLRNSSESGTYGRYNLGIALLRLGQAEKAVKEINKVGRRNFRSDEMKALKDRANVALGYFFLRTQKPEDAKIYLERVRLNGTHANHALLGIGMANLMLKQYKDALVPLLELHGRPNTDSTVAEAYLAVPYIFSRAESDNQALNFYDAAIHLLETDLERIDVLTKQLESSQLFASWLKGDLNAVLKNWPGDPLKRVFGGIISRNWFHAALENYRDLQALEPNLLELETVLNAYQRMQATRRTGRGEKSSAINTLPAITQNTIDLVDPNSLEYMHFRPTLQLEVDLDTRKLQELLRETHTLKRELERLTSGYEALLQDAVVARLDKETQRINRYLNQARFGSAQIIDRLMTQGAFQ